MTQLREITEAELDQLAIGAWILGTGGGGDPYNALLAIKKLYRQGKRVRLMDPMDLADNDRVAVVSQMGAPLVGQERLIDPSVMHNAVRMMEDYLQEKFRAVMSVEIGGGNAISPFLAAALLDIPVLDADAMGRAFPEAQMTSFAIMDLQMYPLTMADIRDNAVIFTRAASWKWMERMSRKATTELGSVTATCKAPRTGKEVKECGILYTVTQAIAIGCTVQEARRRHADPVQAVIEDQHGKLLFQGKVADIFRRTTEGFLRGTTKIEGLDNYRGHTFTLEFQNEFAIGQLDDKVIVTVPDLICVMDTLSGDAIGTETLRYGQRVTVIALPSPPLLMTERGLRYVGPRAFGYDIDFNSIFKDERA